MTLRLSGIVFAPLLLSLSLPTSPPLSLCLPVSLSPCLSSLSVSHCLSLFPCSQAGMADVVDMARQKGEEMAYGDNSNGGWVPESTEMTRCRIDYLEPMTRCGTQHIV
jgi:hypothetical protein